MEVIGKLVAIMPTNQVSEKFSKREFVVETEEQYPQKIQMEFTQDKCSILDSYSVGDSVKVSINLRGRDWTNPQGEVKYFNTIQAWRVEKIGANEQKDTRTDVISNTQQENDDLPF